MEREKGKLRTDMPARANHHRHAAQFAMKSHRLIDVRRHSSIGTIAKMKDTIGKSRHFHASVVDCMRGARWTLIARMLLCGGSLAALRRAVLTRCAIRRDHGVGSGGRA